MRPPGDSVYNVDETREAAIITWRADCFERYGFARYLATALAVRRDVDREYVATLIARGATPTQIAGIVL